MFEYEMVLVASSGHSIGRSVFKARDMDAAEAKFFRELKKFMKAESVVRGGYFDLKKIRDRY